MLPIARCAGSRAPVTRLHAQQNKFRKLQQTSFVDLVGTQGQQSASAALEGFRRTVDSPVLQGRLRLMWDRYEEALAELLAEESASQARLQGAA